MISRSSSNKVHLRPKSRSQELKIEKSLQTSGCSFDPDVRKVVFMISRSSMNMGHLCHRE
jgi:hypothetical protein